MKLLFSIALMLFVVSVDGHKRSHCFKKVPVATNDEGFHNETDIFQSLEWYCPSKNKIHETSCCFGETSTTVGCCELPPLRSEHYAYVMFTFAISLFVIAILVTIVCATGMHCPYYGGACCPTPTAKDEGLPSSALVNLDESLMPSEHGTRKSTHYLLHV